MVMVFCSFIISFPIAVLLMASTFPLQICINCLLTDQVFPLTEEVIDLKLAICFAPLLAQSYCFWSMSYFVFEGSGAISKVALKSLVQRCREVLSKYTEDERLNGQFPLPRWEVLTCPILTLTLCHIQGSRVIFFHLKVPNSCIEFFNSLSQILSRSTIL